MEERSTIPVLEKIRTLYARATTLVKRLVGMSYEERLRTSVLSSLEKSRLKGDPINLYNFLGRGNGEGGVGLFSLVTDDRTHGNVTKLSQRRTKLNIRKIFIYCEGGQTLEQAS